ncbi:hypothetical protein HAX54_014575, partial [Datura stramonium]|nr:hypothetical protein [Datura stramonium]
MGRSYLFRSGKCNEPLKVLTIGSRKRLIKWKIGCAQFCLFGICTKLHPPIFMKEERLYENGKGYDQSLPSPIFAEEEKDNCYWVLGWAMSQ